MDVLCENSMDSILQILHERKPKLAIIDSVQTVSLTDVVGSNGSVSQVVSPCVLELFYFLACCARYSSLVPDSFSLIHGCFGARMLILIPLCLEPVLYELCIVCVCI